MKKAILKIFSNIPVVLTLMSIVFFASCGKEKKADSDFVFKIGTANASLCPAPLHIAIDKGIFEEEFSKAGLKYEVIEINLLQATELI